MSTATATQTSKEFDYFAYAIVVLFSFFFADQIFVQMVEYTPSVISTFEESMESFFLPVFYSILMLIFAKIISLGFPEFAITNRPHIIFQIIPILVLTHPILVFYGDTAFTVIFPPEVLP